MPKATRERTKNLFILRKSQEGCFGFLHHGCFAGVKKKNGPNPFKCLLHRRQGVPLKGPFLGHFSQGNLSKVNENVLFSDFRMFCYFDPTSLGFLTPALLGSFDLEITDKRFPSKRFPSIFHPDGKDLHPFPKLGKNQEWG